MEIILAYLIVGFTICGVVWLFWDDIVNEKGLLTKLIGIYLFMFLAFTAFVWAVVTIGGHLLI